MEFRLGMTSEWRLYLPDWVSLTVQRNKILVILFVKSLNVLVWFPYNIEKNIDMLYIYICFRHIYALDITLRKIWPVSR